MAAEIIFKEGDTHGTPSADYVKLYAKTDSNLYFKDDAGNEYIIAGAGVNLVRSELAATASFTFSVPDGYIISTFSALYNSGSAIVITVGTTLAGNDLVYGLKPASGDTVPRIATVNAEVTNGSAATIYVTLAGTNPNVDIYMLLIKLR